jgi:hypothetical protein
MKAVGAVGCGAVRLTKRPQCGRFEHYPLAAAQEAKPQRQRAQQRHHRQRDLHAKKPLAAPVHVLELEQQCRLVEREAHADAERQGEPRLEPLSRVDPSR